MEDFFVQILSWRKRPDRDLWELRAVVKDHATNKRLCNPQVRSFRSELKAFEKKRLEREFQREEQAVQEEISGLWELPAAA